jgi:hypothetical protein
MAGYMQSSHVVTRAWRQRYYNQGFPELAHLQRYDYRLLSLLCSKMFSSCVCIPVLKYECKYKNSRQTNLVIEWDARVI